jgi:hypothetical protein
LIEGGFLPSRISLNDLERLMSDPAQLPTAPSDKL